MHPEEDVQETRKAVENMAPGNMDIKRLVSSLPQETEAILTIS
jgi:hypothetical protein